MLSKNKEIILLQKKLNFWKNRIFNQLQYICYCREQIIIIQIQQSICYSFEEFAQYF